MSAIGSVRDPATSAAAAPPAPPARPRDPQEARQAADQFRQELRAEAEKFEAFFLQQMLNAMRKSTPGNPFFGHDPGSRTFQDLLNEEYGRTIAHGGKGVGIADLLMKKLGARRAPPAVGPSGATLEAIG